MTICAVIDLDTNQQINIIVAEENDLPPQGCKLITIPDGYYWNGNDMVPVPIEMNDGN